MLRKQLITMMVQQLYHHIGQLTNIFTWTYYQKGRTMENVVDYFIGAVVAFGFVILAHLVVEGLSDSYHMDDED